MPGSDDERREECHNHIRSASTLGEILCYSGDATPGPAQIQQATTDPIVGFLSNMAQCLNRQPKENVAIGLLKGSSQALAGSTMHENAIYAPTVEDEVSNVRIQGQSVHSEGVFATNSSNAGQNKLTTEPLSDLPQLTLGALCMEAYLRFRSFKPADRCVPSPPNF